VYYSPNRTGQRPRLTDIVSIFANGNAQRFITDNTPWQNYQLAGVGGGMQFRFTDPLFKSQLPWSIALSANVQWWSYDAPDVTVDPTSPASRTIRSSMSPCSCRSTSAPLSPFRVAGSCAQRTCPTMNLSTIAR
jgi:hypothetical protein